MRLPNWHRRRSTYIQEVLDLQRELNLNLPQMARYLDIPYDTLYYRMKLSIVKTT